MRCAISRSVGLDLVYACYSLFKLAQFSREPTQVIINHIFGLHQVMEYLRSSSSSVQKSEWEWMDILLLDSLVGLYYHLRTLVRYPPLFVPQIEKICALLNDYHFQKTTLGLEVSINYYCTYYQLLVNEVVGDGRKIALNEITAVSNTIRRLIQQLVDIVPQLNDRLLGSLHIFLSTDPFATNIISYDLLKTNSYQDHVNLSDYCYANVIRLSRDIV